jgi:CubicO group peptidase (beta-lactamase class C family)
VLSHTSGYQDFWPQDYVPPYMLKAVSPEQVLERWAHKKLDFEPGTQWQYSNTGYIVAGLVFERASGESVFEFLRQRVFTPLGMKSVFNFDEEPMSESDPLPYLRNGLGPLRIAPTSGKGWLYAAGELAMTAEDLAKWDISIINQTLLKPASYHEMASAMILKNGVATDYGLGVHVKQTNSHRFLIHGGEVSGFTANNMAFPDDGIAIVALVNQDASSAPGDIGRKIAKLLLPSEGAAQEEEQALRIIEGLQRGKIERGLFSENGNSYFTSQTLKDLTTGLKPLGKPTAVKQESQSARGGMTGRRFTIKFSKKKIEVTEFVLPDGKIEQFQVTGVE